MNTANALRPTSRPTSDQSKTGTDALSDSVWVFLLLASEAIKTNKGNPSLALGPYRVPTWLTPIFLVLTVSFLFPRSSLLGHLCGLAVGYVWGLGYLKIIVPPERILRFIEAKVNPLRLFPRYISVDQKTYGRYGVLGSADEEPVPISFSSPQRMGR